MLYRVGRRLRFGFVGPSRDVYVKSHSREVTGTGKKHAINYYIQSLPPIKKSVSIRQKGY